MLTVMNNGYYFTFENPLVILNLLPQNRWYSNYRRAIILRTPLVTVAYWENDRGSKMEKVLQYVKLVCCIYQKDLSEESDTLLKIELFINILKSQN